MYLVQTELKVSTPWVLWSLHGINSGNASANVMPGTSAIDVHDALISRPIGYRYWSSVAIDKRAGTMWFYGYIASRSFFLRTIVSSQWKRKK
jgi:hypothetical protein